MNIKTLFAASLIVALGVSAISTAPQTRAAGVTTAIQTIVPTDFDTTWNVLLRELDEGDFTINAFQVVMPDGPGLGMILSDEALARFAV